MAEHDEIRLPETVEEYQRALRKAFEAGAFFNAHASFRQEVVDSEVRHRYPIRVRKPRVVKVPRLPGGEREVKVEDGEFWIRNPGNEEWTRQYAVITADTIHTLADLLANPYEEVDE
ncbi:MAG TPA: hypothetical protein VFI96_04215 [Longimicrobiaceae bacterium]|nr:hypothetical protein [Longimicrobiaceae bacterium]